MLQETRRRSTPADQAETGSSDVFAFLGAIWRGRMTVIACALVMLVIGFYYAFIHATPRYAATTTLALELRSESVVDIEAIVSGVSTEDAAMNTELEVIRSRGLLETLVRDMDLTEDPEFNPQIRPEPFFQLSDVVALIRAIINQPAPTEAEYLSPEQVELNATVREVRDRISASVQRNTYIFSITATTTSKRKSQEVANRLAELYIADQVNQKYAATENAATWLSERVSELEIDLRAREDQLKEFRTQTDLVSLDAIEALNSQLADTRDRLADVETQESIARAALDQIRSLRDAEDLAGLDDYLQDAQLRRLIDAGQSLDNPAIQARLDSLETARQVEIARLGSQITALSNSRDRQEDQLAAQSDDLSQFQQFERELEATRTLYETFLSRLKEATVQRGLQDADSRILSAATPGQYVSPRKAVILALSLILGVMIGSAIVILRQFISIGYRTAEELENDLDLPILGQIPIIPIKKRSALIDYLSDKSTAAAAEAIRNLRTSLLLANGNRPPQVIMSTSSVPGEGKTTQAVSLAHNLAGLNKRVLLIEGDVRRRTLDEHFTEVPRQRKGLASLLQSDDLSVKDVIVRDPRLNADIILGEKSSVNAADLFSSERFSVLIDAMRAEYDFVVIDTPPVLVVPDARVIGHHVDAIIFSVLWNATSKQQVRESVRQLSIVNLEPSGMILSKIDASAMKRYGYGGKYGAYGSYGRDYYDA